MPTTAELVTPERILFSGEAEFVVLRSEGGEVMFLPHHAPYVSAVDISVVRIATSASEQGEGPSGEEFRAAVHGGFVHVVNNKVTILASVAEPAEEIDVLRARRAEEEARSHLSSEGGERHREELGDQETVEQSQTMKALLRPDDPEVALRRAEVRLEAAGETG